MTFSSLNYVFTILFDFLRRQNSKSQIAILRRNRFQTLQTITEILIGGALMSPHLAHKEPFEDEHICKDVDYI